MNHKYFKNNTKRQRKKEKDYLLTFLSQCQH